MSATNDALLLQQASENSSFLPYNSIGMTTTQHPKVVHENTMSIKQPPSYGTALQQKFNQQLMNVNGQQQQPLCTDVFAPVSSIKPMKRGNRGGKGGPNSKRMRHHSAQSALAPTNKRSAAKAQASMLTYPLQPQLQDKLTFSFQNSATSLALSNDNGSGIPESPFSPEIQDIMSGVDPQMSNTANNNHMFRSQSVPIQDMFGKGMESQDIFSLTDSMLEQRNDSLDIMDIIGNNTEEITNLLQGKLQNENSDGRGLHIPNSAGFSARRNLIDLLEHKANNSTDSEIGGVTLSSVNLRHKQEFGRVNSGPVPTPPSSQNPTPDFSNEFANMVNNGDQGMFSNGGPGSGVQLDTPSSLDTLSTQDSRDSLGDPLFGGMYDAPADMTADLGLQSWDMQQMVHD